MSLSYTELKSVVPELRQITINNEQFTIKRFGLRKLKDAATHAAYISVLLAQLDSGISPFEVLIQGGDAAFNLMSLAIDKPIEFFDDVDPVEGADLFLAVVEVNVDFFVNTLSQRLPELTQRLTSIFEKVSKSPTAA